MRVLVTGGAGFIGSHLIERLLKEGHKVDCLDNFNEYYSISIKRKNIQSASGFGTFQLFEGDILDESFLETVFGSGQYDVVVHLAARAGVRPSLLQPQLYEHVNVRGTMNLLEMCRTRGVRRFICASSSSVYGRNQKIPFHEDDPVDHPISPYAATKKAVELMCYTYHHLYDMNIHCHRFFTVYGPRQRPDMAIHKFTQLIYDEEPIPVFGTLDSRRDYTYIDDIIQGLLASIDRCQGYRVYNLGESTTTSLGTLVRMLEHALGKTAKLDRLPAQSGDVPVTYADISRAKMELNYNPQTTIKEGIEKFVEWYLKTHRTRMDRS